MPRKPITPDNAFLRLATLCARCEQAEGDLRKKLRDWGIASSDADAIIDRLKQERYLDNERYAHAYCRDKLRFNGWGRIKIAFMLKGKGVEQEFIDAALAQIDEEQYVHQHGQDCNVPAMFVRKKGAAHEDICHRQKRTWAYAHHAAESKDTH